MPDEPAPPPADSEPVPASELQVGDQFWREPDNYVRRGRWFAPFRCIHVGRDVEIGTGTFHLLPAAHILHRWWPVRAADGSASYAADRRFAVQRGEAAGMVR